MRVASAAQEVGTLTAQDEVSAWPATQRVISAPADPDDDCAEEVTALAADEDVRPSAADHHVATMPAQQQVRTSVPAQTVSASAPVDGVIACTGAKVVTSATGQDLVVTAPGMDLVALSRSHQLVRAIGSTNHRRLRQRRRRGGTDQHNGSHTWADTRKIHVRLTPSEKIGQSDRRS